MQPAHFQLKEITWEICGKCLNKCTYCGSKDGWNKPIDTDRIIKIAEALAQFPPLAINVTGGDPLLVPDDIHEKIIKLFKDKNIFCKIIINPKSFEQHIDDYTFDLLNLYDHIGISINDPKELDALNSFDKAIKQEGEKVRTPDLLKKTTIITNFNTSNIFNFELIKNFVKSHNLPWQIQFTVTKKEDDPSYNIYDNDEAIKHFSFIIRQAVIEKTKIIFSDTMSDSPCFAGRNSLGITYDGDVVPCLSMITWDGAMTEGNILKTSLHDLWVKGFYNYRFNEFECCKDRCKNRVIGTNVFTQKEKEEIGVTITTDQWDDLIKGIKEQKINPQPIVTYYGCSPYVPYPYKPYDPKDHIVMAYAVSIGGRDSTEIKTTSTSEEWSVYDIDTNTITPSRRA